MSYVRGPRSPACRLVLVHGLLGMGLHTGSEWQMSEWFHLNMQLLSSASIPALGPPQITCQALDSHTGTNPWCQKGWGLLSKVTRLHCFEYKNMTGGEGCSLEPKKDIHLKSFV